MVIQSLNGIYLHCAWATSDRGDDFSLTEFADATYCGTYSDNSSTESTEPRSYNWMLIGDIAGADNGTDEAINVENATILANQQASNAQAQTIVNNDNIQASQDDTDMSTGNPNELIGTNQGTNNWTASAGLTISAQSGTIYNPNDEAVNYLHVACDTAGTNYIAFDASALRDKLAELTEDNSFTLSADINMSTVFDMPVMVSDDDGTNIQIDFGTIEPELVPVPEETADGLWVFSKSTADCENEVAVSSQVVLFDLSNMGAGETLDIANLKIEGGALATPWRASLDEVANIANQAYSVANNTQQHFWFQSTGLDTGAHITEVDKATWDLDPSNGGGNLLARSNGIALRDGLVELATLQQSGLDVNTYDGGGNQVNIAHLGYGTVIDGTGTPVQGVYYNLGYRATGSDIGEISHVEGSQTEASAYCSHAEGMFTHATAPRAHAEGENCVASGYDSHAEGTDSVASGNISHAQNHETIAAKIAQTALGTYNVEDTSPTTTHPNGIAGYGQYAAIIGNGTSDNARSNALTVDWSGNVVASGDIKAGADLYINNTKVADYVISRGTSGNWKYIKWASGRVECEGWYTFSSLTFSQRGSSYRSSATAFTIPSGIFSSTPTECHGWIQASSASDYFGVVLNATSTTGGNCMVWKATSGNATNVAVHMRFVYRG